MVPIGDKRHEIDFVVNRAPGKLYIQVAYELPNEAKREQEMLPLRKCDDFFRKMINICKQMNYSPFKSEQYYDFKKQVTDMINA